MDQESIQSGETIEFVVPEEAEGMRLDQWLSMELAEEASRSVIQKWIQSGALTGEKKKLRSSMKVTPGQTFTLQVPEEPEVDLTPVDMNLDVLYEDDHLAVILKPPGLAVHPGPGDQEKTLIQGLLHLWKDLPVSGDKTRPGIVHRLDKPTEGLLLVAKNSRSLRLLSESFQERKVEKRYSAWLLACPREAVGTVDQPIARNPRERLKMRIDPAGRPARSHYRIEKSIVSVRGRKYSLADIQIETGRTHQIRVHMAHLGAPVVGDLLYSRSGKRFESSGLLLFARSLAFKHPISGRPMEFVLDLPERFRIFEESCVNY